MLTRADPADLENLLTAKRLLIALHKAVGPERDVLRELTREEAFVSADAYRYFQDVGDHLARVEDCVETYRDVAAGAMDIYLSSVSNRMNEIMKQLTVVATIFMPLTLISGIYGMNVLRGMWPPAEAAWSFAAIVGAHGGHRVGHGACTSGGRTGGRPARRASVAPGSRAAGATTATTSTRSPTSSRSCASSSCPFFFAVLINGKNDVLAFVLFVLAASTDWLDGQIARRTGTVTAIGKAIDPLVDRLLIASGVIGLYIDRPAARCGSWSCSSCATSYLLYGAWLLERHHRRIPVTFVGQGDHGRAAHRLLAADPRTAGRAWSRAATPLGLARGLRWRARCRWHHGSLHVAQFIAARGTHGRQRPAADTAGIATEGDAS